MSKSLTFDYTTVPAGGGIPEHDLMKVNGTVFAAIYREDKGYRIVARLGSKEGQRIATTGTHHGAFEAGAAYAVREGLGR